MPNLRVKISGLCVFAFERPLKTSVEPPTAATLLLQKLTHARALSNVPNQRYEILDQHFPLFVYNLADRDSASTRTTDFLAVPDANGKQMTKGVCLLFGDDVKILSDMDSSEKQNGRSDGKNGASRLQFDLKGPKDKDNPTEDELKSLWWMATLQDAFPEAEIDPVFVQSAPGANQAILARVKLDRGLLTTDQRTDRPCTFVSPGNQKFDQQVATSFNLDIPFKEKIVIEITRKIEGRVEPSKLILAPSGHGSGGLEIEIKNMEIDELIGMKRSYSPRPEADFEIYADLLKKKPDGFSAPKTTTYLRQTGPGNPAGIRNSTCPPTGG
jgi:hypothetical protein